VSQEFKKTTDQLDALLREFESTPSISRGKSSRRAKRKVKKPDATGPCPANSSPKHAEFSQASSTPQEERSAVHKDAHSAETKALVKQRISKKTEKCVGEEEQSKENTCRNGKLRFGVSAVPKDDKISDMSSEEGEAHALISTMAKLAEERRVERLRRNAEVTSRYKTRMQGITMETEEKLQNAAVAATLKLTSRLDLTIKQISNLESQFLSAIKFAQVCLRRGDVQVWNAIIPPLIKLYSYGG
jgi:hypothetical protein